MIKLMKWAWQRLHHTTYLLDVKFKLINYNKLNLEALICNQHIHEWLLYDGEDIVTTTVCWIEHNCTITNDYWPGDVNNAESSICYATLLDSYHILHQEGCFIHFLQDSIHDIHRFSNRQLKRLKTIINFYRHFNNISYDCHLFWKIVNSKF